jgi:hypothetical protein
MSDFPIFVLHIFLLLIKLFIFLELQKYWALDIYFINIIHNLHFIFRGGTRVLGLWWAKKIKIKILGGKKNWFLGYILKETKNLGRIFKYLGATLGSVPY